MALQLVLVGGVNTAATLVKIISNLLSLPPYGVSSPSSQNVGVTSGLV
jgi:hypothetical protein